MEFLTLSQLNSLVSAEIKDAFPETYWLVAETSDVRHNKNGHCYLEFIEKNELTHAIIAKARGYIWSSTFQLIQPYFEKETGQAFVSGIKVLVKVSIDFHSVYGYGLSVVDIDPTYTTGDMNRQRQKILDQLEAEGILLLNQELEMPLLPQRIAVITSPTAAGYEDFLNHLQHNDASLVFYPKLFPAVMQGEQTTKSIIFALDKIYRQQDFFDTVVIIRGGGATSDLASFDTYELAANCAQFPLPIITGIGHERDDTVLDFVAYHRAKTPTAVADYLVGLLEEVAAELFECQSNLVHSSNRLLDTNKNQLQQIAHHLPLYVHNRIEQQKTALQIIQQQLQIGTQQFLLQRKLQLKNTEAFLKLSSPEYILSRGYSITLKNGKAVKSAAMLQAGDEIETRLAEGSVNSVVR